MDSAFGRLGRGVVRFRWLILAAWLVLLVVGGLGARALPGVLSGGGFDAPSSESAEAAQLLGREFLGQAAHTVLLVFEARDRGADDPDYRQAVERIAADVAEVPGVQAVNLADGLQRNRPASTDSRVSFTSVTLSAADRFEASQIVPHIRDAIAASAQPAWLSVDVTGAPAVEYDVTQASAADLVEAERIGLPITLVLLVVAFGALVAAGLPVLVGLGSIVVTMGLAYLIAQATDLSSAIMNAVPMLGLGVGIDYCLFIVSRFREELARTQRVEDAVVGSVATAGRAVAFSGLTVAIGLSALLVPDLMMLRSVGLGGIVVVAVAVLAALTLLPALLVVVGRRVDWPRVSLPRAVRDGEPVAVWHRWALAVMRRPVLAATAAVLALGLLAAPALRLQTIAPGATLLPAGSGARDGFETLARGFGPGEMAPLQLIVDTGRADGLWAGESIAGLRALADRLASAPGVARVDSIVGLGAELTPVHLRALLGQAGDAPADPRLTALAAMVARDGSATLLRVVPAVDPNSVEGRDLVERIRGEGLTDLAWPAGTRLLVGGSTASSLDMERELYGSFPLVVGLVLALSFVVLAVLLRSVVLPLKAIAMNALSVLASYGLLVLIFQDGYGAEVLGFAPPGAISSLIPVFLFCILFGLSMDYEIFILSRMREAYRETGSNELGVALGLERTGRIVTSAALIMVSVFGAFALSRFTLMKELGIGLSAAVLLDATLIRVVLVPATMRLLGRWNWWTPQLRRGASAEAVTGS